MQGSSMISSNSGILATETDLDKFIALSVVLLAISFGELLALQLGRFRR